ncbi:DUF3349 domain-containing protein [Jongsikchunia kroppenstedtii]|uniref:DUF3349 domain-containing protein n=1 Tax=Jongsikchunia kroppenstedtii TaxID=1121721 RepID=UPI00037E7B80|nr:DUF3349 domain-containing protein [Jongsikchunia kroppenstedtii]
MDRPHFLKTIVDWLREGYPNGIPSGDYVPLVALLRRRLTDDEVKQITHDLISQQRSGTEVTDDGGDDLAPISKIDAGVQVIKAIDELPSESDIKRIRERLERKGWPFDDEPFGGESAEHDSLGELDDRDGESGRP